MEQLTARTHRASFSRRRRRPATPPPQEFHPGSSAGKSFRPCAGLANRTYNTGHAHTRLRPPPAGLETTGPGPGARLPGATISAAALTRRPAVPPYRKTGRTGTGRASRPSGPAPGRKPGPPPEKKRRMNGAHMQSPRPALRTASSGPTLRVGSPGPGALSDAAPQDHENRYQPSLVGCNRSETGAAGAGNPDARRRPASRCRPPKTSTSPIPSMPALLATAGRRAGGGPTAVAPSTRTTNHQRRLPLPAQQRGSGS